MNRSNGVATKYLGGYLGWRLLLERYQSVITPELCLLEAVGRVSEQLSRTSPFFSMYLVLFMYKAWFFVFYFNEVLNRAL